MSTTPSTDNKVDNIVPQDTMKEVLDRAYNQGIDHCIATIKRMAANVYADKNFHLNSTVIDTIISQLEQLKSK